MADAPLILHASAVRYADQAVLITGASGAGKSALALQLIALGAALIADDRVILQRQDNAVIASCPDTITGLIEARGVGILNTPAAPAAPVSLVVDLDQVETARLPPQRNVTFADTSLPLLWRVDAPHFAAAVLQAMLHGRSSR